MKRELTYSPEQVVEILAFYGIYTTVENVCWLRQNDVFISYDGQRITESSLIRYLEDENINID